MRAALIAPLVAPALALLVIVCLNWEDPKEQANAVFGAVMVAGPLAYMATWLYGVPAAFALEKRDLCGPLTLALAGLAPGLLYAAWEVTTRREALSFYLFSPAAAGALVGAVFGFLVRAPDLELNHPRG